jgi:tRNA-splicing ligase RtcB (3'-phosphate/5'-hydroxy nucleic acid ligase)
MFNLQKIAPATYLVPKTGNMRVPALLIATEELLQDMDLESPLQQLCNVATLPGILGYSVAMPDIHWGYGFPIGGVAAMDIQTGVISPGGVGYDINCGVRFAFAPIDFRELDEEKKEKLLQRIFATVPSGVGHGHKGVRGLSDRDYTELLREGAKWSVRHGFGFEEDLRHVESNGVILGGDFEAVSKIALSRGKNQLGTIGSGNHFIEIGEVQKVLIPETAQKWGVKEGQLYILIHTGSRGFGHQVCQDTLNDFMRKGYADGLPDKQLVAAPIQSPDGQKYFAAMAAAANFAFNNRQQILHFVRQAFLDVLGIDPRQISLLYDVCHNIAKFEEHEIDGVLRKVCVHRKGATRALGPHSEELAIDFQETGQPVLIPGDMGRASYLLSGLGNKLAFRSACHGAGRAKSRIQSKKEWSGRDPVAYMEKQGVKVLASSMGTITEEMPDAYKDVDQVVEAASEAGLAKMVARLKPHLVIKG